MAIGPEDARWTRLRKLFDELYELDPRPRDEALARVASDDAELARELATLLTEGDDDWLAPLLRKQRVGEWQLELRGTRGAPGAYDVWHASSGQRAVLRVLALDGLDAVARLRGLVPRLIRFRREGFARVLEGGLCQAPGEPQAAVYLVEELVEPARALAAHVADASFPTAGRVTSLARACEAVRDLHSLELVHGRLDRTTLGVDAHGFPRVCALGVATLSSAGGPPLPADDVCALAEVLSVLANACRADSRLGALAARAGTLDAAGMAAELRKLAALPGRERGTEPFRER